jgi:polysaccharide export outer membrane protein
MSRENLMHNRRYRPDSYAGFSKRLGIGLTAVLLMPGLGFAAAAGPPGQSANQRPAPAQSAAPESTTADAGYRIGAGDVLQIDVWKEPEASVPTVVVRPDGKLTLPLIKEVDALGLTPSELEKVVAAKLGQLIKNADVTVVVKEIRSKRVYIVGAVNKIGPVALLSQMTILQALAEAGGLTDYAKKGKIYVLRSENGKQLKLSFDYGAVTKGEHMEQNITLHPDDTIVVPH